MLTSDLATAFMLGLAGSGHCLSMCGGVNSIVLASKPLSDQSTGSPVALLVPLFSLGRISSYALAGLVVGSLSFTVQTFSPAIVHWARLLAGVMLLLMACYIGRWWLGLTRIEAVAGKLWRYLQPLTTSLLPVRTPIAAVLLGALWGWLPCGMVYSALAWAVLTAKPYDASILMLVFGLGTLPSMLSAGYFAEGLNRVLQNHTVKNTAAGLLLIFALWTIINAVEPLLNGGSATVHQHSHSH